MSERIKVELVSLNKNTVTIRLPDGQLLDVPGTNALMVYCNRNNLERHLAGTERDVELDFTWDGKYLTAFGMALWL